VVDLVSQALAWQFFETNLIPARPYGVRTSFEIKALIDDAEYQGENPKRKEDAERAIKLLPVLANILRVDQPGLEFGLRVIARDPYSIFLYEVWNWNDGRGRSTGVIGP
jgi:hypothetical protein